MISELADIVNILRTLLLWVEFAWQQGKKKRCRSNAFFYYAFSQPAKGKPVADDKLRTN